MYKVKIITGKNGDNMFRQMPGESHISRCGKYEFFVDQDIPDPDFLVVRNKYIKKKVTYNVAPANTILMLSEPPSVINFPKRYRNQFGMLCSCQADLKHHNIRYCNAVLPWFVGLTGTQGELSRNHITYDNLSGKEFPQKSKLMSVITSNKAFTKGHQDRIAFVHRLKEYYGDSLDLFGRGFNEFDDKWDVLAPYKYHIAIENSSAPYYWTEKLSDCYLAGTYPIYYGATNVGEYFPQGAYTPISIYDFDQAVEVIDSLIERDAYDSSLEALKQSKNLVLDQYNIFDYIARCCDELDPKAEKQALTLHPAMTILDWRNFYQQVIQRNYYKIKNSLKK